MVISTGKQAILQRSIHLRLGFLKMTEFIELKQPPVTRSQSNPYPEGTQTSTTQMYKHFWLNTTKM